MDKGLPKQTVKHWGTDDWQPGQRQVDTPRIAAVARLAHEVNRGYSAALGDCSHQPWSQAPDWQKESAIAGVRMHLESGFTATPEQSHESWLKHKQAEGWVYGPVKDPEKKEHPCMLPYKELPREQRIKDALFVAVVHAAFNLEK